MTCLPLFASRRRSWTGNISGFNAELTAGGLTQPVPMSETQIFYGKYLSIFLRSKLPPSSRPKTLLPYRRRNLFLRNVRPEPTTCTLTRNKTAAFIHRCVNLKPPNSVTKYLFLTSGPFFLNWTVSADRYLLSLLRASW